MSAKFRFECRLLSDRKLETRHNWSVVTRLERIAREMRSTKERDTSSEMRDGMRDKIVDR